MVVIEAVFAFTLSVYFSIAQNPQSSWQMPQYQAGGLSFSPVLKAFAQHELYEQQQQQQQVSSRQRCVLEHHERIECGEPDITEEECDAISCCYDGQNCYYARAGESSSYIKKIHAYFIFFLKKRFLHGTVVLWYMVFLFKTRKL